MGKYNYFYNGTAITKQQFTNNVPEYWEDAVADSTYSYGKYKAIERE